MAHKAMNLSGKLRVWGLGWLFGLQVKLESLVLPPENGDIAIPDACKLPPTPSASICGDELEWLCLPLIP